MSSLNFKVPLGGGAAPGLPLLTGSTSQHGPEGCAVSHSFSFSLWHRGQVTNLSEPQLPHLYNGTHHTHLASGIGFKQGQNWGEAQSEGDLGPGTCRSGLEHLAAEGEGLLKFCALHLALALGLQYGNTCTLGTWKAFNTQYTFLTCQVNPGSRHLDPGLAVPQLLKL